MVCASRFVVAAAVLFLSGRVVQAQDSSASVNPALVGRGKALFATKGCTICHSVGGGRVVLAGPDLLGVTDRRSVDWLRRWLRAPEAMYETDSVAIALVMDAKGTKMPNLHLAHAEIDALISYLAAESQGER